MTNSTQEAKALFVKVGAELAGKIIEREWCRILVEALEARDNAGTTEPDFTRHSVDSRHLIFQAEAYYGGRLTEIESKDNVAAFIDMVQEVIGDQLAEHNLQPCLFRNKTSGDIRLYFLQPGQTPA